MTVRLSDTELSKIISPASAGCNETMKDMVMQIDRNIALEAQRKLVRGLERGDKYIQRVEAFAEGEHIIIQFAGCAEYIAFPLWRWDSIKEELGIK